MNVSAELVQRAIEKLRRGHAAHDVAAVFAGEVSSADLDGAAWRFVVVAGNQVDTLVAGTTGTDGGEPGMDVDEAALERAVEALAAKYPRESRLADMVAAAPLRIRLA